MASSHKFSSKAQRVISYLIKALRNRSKWIRRTTKSLCNISKNSTSKTKLHKNPWKKITLVWCLMMPHKASRKIAQYSKMKINWKVVRFWSRGRGVHRTQMRFSEVSIRISINPTSSMRVWCLINLEKWSNTANHRLGSVWRMRWMCWEFRSTLNLLISRLLTSR
jgi:hypothetical protein